MKLIISNKLYVIDATTKVFLWCKKYLEFPNPEYAKKQQMGLWTGNIDSIIVLWEKRGADAILPYGVLSQFLDEFGAETEIEDQSTPSVQRIDYHSKIKLFGYQEEALENVFRNGIIVMPCGSGKTQTALELVSRLGLRTLWLTHTYELLKQSMDRAKGCFELPETEYGTITEGRISVGKAITFATVQTMCKMDLSPYSNYWNVVIVDECHKAVGTPKRLMMFYKVVSGLNAYYKIGLTATPKRNDGLERCMYALLGKQLSCIPDSAVAANTVPVCVYQYESNTYEPNLSNVLNTDGTLNYTSLITDMCSNVNRNKELSMLINNINYSGLTCLVLSDRVEHLEILRNMVGKDYTEQIYSNTAKKVRKECIDKLRSKEIRCLFATYQLAKEGLDIATLDYVVFATPKKDRITVIQSCGRVGRKATNKYTGFVLDFVDSQFGLTQNWARIRKNFYKNKNFFIKVLKNTLLFCKNEL